MSDYEYEVEEYSQDTRTFTVNSNKKLPQDVVDTVYYCITQHHRRKHFLLPHNVLNDSDANKEHDITQEVYDVLKNKGYDTDHEDFKELKVITIFTGTEYGDNSQVESSGDFFELEEDE